MDLLMTDFVKSIINDLEFNELICLNEFIELDDEILKSLKNKESINNFNPKLNFILEKFQKF